ncbi:Uncharacterised protein [Serratia fonticola]|nr:Uncharacterised protein [Serratia fonticola]
MDFMHKAISGRFSITPASQNLILRAVDGMN